MSRRQNFRRKLPQFLYRNRLRLPALKSIIGNGLRPQPLNQEGVGCAGTGGSLLGRSSQVAWQLFFFCPYRVQITSGILFPGSQSTAGTKYLELNGFSNIAGAQSAADMLTEKGLPVLLVHKDFLWMSFNSILIGPYLIETDLAQLHGTLQSEGFSVVPRTWSQVTRLPLLDNYLNEGITKGPIRALVRAICMFLTAFAYSNKKMSCHLRRYPYQYRASPCLLHPAELSDCPRNSLAFEIALNLRRSMRQSWGLKPGFRINLRWRPFDQSIVPEHGMGNSA